MVKVLCYKPSRLFFAESDRKGLITDAVPASIEPLAVRTYLAGLSGVTGVHDLHIWEMSTTETALTAHLVMPKAYTGDAFLVQVNQELHDLFGIEYTTLQVETGNPSYPDPLAQENVVL
ncbi:hypothetical protein QUA41_11360 [Microcoleus sp. Pol11C1]|uniref:cation transporter dimerization domain-containing protein n=1 Tax=unclassified Microcoleus TaxID=2642155 RepID=UPI002FD3FFC9